MTEKKKFKQLTWNPKQIEVYNYIKEGKLFGVEIAKTAGVSGAYVSQVKAAIDAGQSPPESVNPEAPLNEQPADAVVNEEEPEEIFPNEPDPVPDPPQQEQPKSKSPLTSVKSANAKVNVPGVASALKLVQVPVVCPLTPIMMNARAVAQYEFGWNPEMPWEDFFDTVLFHYFKAHGFTLQGYIKDKEVEAAEAKSAVQPQKPPNGNGHLKLNPEDLKEISKNVATYLIAVSQQEV